jgi:hypothetical protein
MREAQEIEDMVALAECAPVATVATLVEDYKHRLNSNFGLYYFSPRGDSEEFENAVFQRKDPYLSLLLAKTVTSAAVAGRLWDFAEASTETSAIYKLCIRRRLLESPSLLFILGAGRYTGAAKVSLFEIISRLGRNHESNEMPMEARKAAHSDACAVLQNPYIRTVLAEIIARQGVYAGISDESLAEAIKYIAKNPVLNIDLTDTGGPDLDAWAIQKAIIALFNDSPPTLSWLFSLERLVDFVEPEVFRGDAIDIEKLVTRWGSLKNRCETDSEEENSRFADKYPGHYTNLDAAQEFLVTLSAKLGSSLVKDKTMTLRDAVSSKRPELLAAYSAKRVGPRSVKDVIELCDSTATYSLLFNTEVICHPESREQLFEAIGDGPLRRLLDRRISWVSSRDCGLYLEGGAVNDGSERGLRSAGVHVDLTNSIEALGHKVSLLDTRLTDALRYLRFLFLGLMILAVLSFR